MPEEVRALTNELRSVNASLQRVLERLDTIEVSHAEIAVSHAEIAKRSTTEWRRAWWHRLVSALLLVLVVAGFLFWRQDRISECENANEARADTRAAIVESLLAITQDADDPERFTPMLERVQQRLTLTIPDRTCPTGVLP